MYNRYMYFEPNSLRNSLVFALGLLFSLLPLFASAQGNPPPHQKVPAVLTTTNSNP